MLLLQARCAIMGLTKVPCSLHNNCWLCLYWGLGIQWTSLPHEWENCSWWTECMICTRDHVTHLSFMSLLAMLLLFVAFDALCNSEWVAISSNGIPHVVRENLVICQMEFKISQILIFHSLVKRMCQKVGPLVSNYYEFVTCVYEVNYVW